ncbi:MAG: hypothetical protein Q7U30_00250 [Methylicorpusculum sp.]|uniref:hypothetical protein n=1 Tax=Methylicorpusculum sp. TaxID=2713644 RepID=UPI00271F9AF9|nr:hypothetical protein [Methylicorpusculum sp.]MDO8843463.1 hypothetical protein [Methylicorpusculum sp.]MDO9238419.1 hypothetical protein [Methylicorpusculum sp.]
MNYGFLSLLVEGSRDGLIPRFLNYKNNNEGEVMMATEIVVTWVGVSVVAVVSALQLAVSLIEKKRLNREINELKLVDDKTAQHDAIRRIRLAWGHDTGALHWSFVLQALFTVIVFSLLLWWGIYLMNQMFYEWAALSVSFALLTVSVTLFVWQGIKYRSACLESLNGSVDLDEQSDEPESVIKASPIIEATRSNINSEPDLSQSAPAKLPEDSVLRRHHMSLIVSQIEDELGERPVDSVLVRHYDHLVLSELMRRLEIEDHTFF